MVPVALYPLFNTGVPYPVLLIRGKDVARA